LAKKAHCLSVEKSLKHAQMLADLAEDYIESRVQ
jgi:hypothetical protein